MVSSLCMNVRDPKMALACSRSGSDLSMRRLMRVLPNMARAGACSLSLQGQFAVKPMEGMRFQALPFGGDLGVCRCHWAVPVLLHGFRASSQQTSLCTAPVHLAPAGATACDAERCSALRCTR